MSARVLAVRQDNNGDVLLAGPALRAIASSASWLALACSPSGEAAARLLPGVDEVIVASAAWIDANPKPVRRDQQLAFVNRVAAGRFDEAVILTSFHQSPLPMALLLKMAGIARIGAISEDYPGSLLDVRHRNVDNDIHEVERALSLARACGYDLPPHDDARLAMRVEPPPVPLPAPYIVVHPGATVPARAWDPARNRVLVAALAERGRKVVVTGAAGELELTAYVAGDDALDYGGRTTFAQLAGAIADADAIVVGNTGAAHVAAAVGTPTVSLFPPTIPASRFRPWNVRHVLLGDQEIPCRGCRARVCPYEDQPCLGCVGVDDVLHAIADLIPLEGGVR